MKKGDIVRIKPEWKESMDWAAGDMTAYDHVAKSDLSKMPEHLTIKHVTPQLYCGGIDDGFEFEEIPGSYKERAFELAMVVDNTGVKNY
jgi:hypothetical protein